MVVGIPKEGLTGLVSAKPSFANDNGKDFKACFSLMQFKYCESQVPDLLEASSCTPVLYRSNSFLFHSDENIMQMKENFPNFIF